MKNISFSLFAILIVAAIGCKKPIVDEHTKSIDSALTYLEAAKLTVESVSTEKLNEMSAQLDEFNEFYTNEYQDTTNYVFYTHELADMADCKKFFDRTKSGLVGWSKELDLTIKQLKTLKHDYENSLISKDSISFYLTTELEASYGINSKVQKNVGMCSSCMRNFDALAFKLDSVKQYFISIHK